MSGGAETVDRDWLAEQRFRAVLEVLDGSAVSEVGVRYGVSRQAVYTWMAKHAAGGVDALREASLRPRTSPTVMTHTVAVNQQLQTALNTRLIIEQAKGVLAERASIDMDQAFTLLSTHARTTRRPLADLARAVVDGVETDAVLHPKSHSANG